MASEGFGGSSLAPGPRAARAARSGPVRPFRGVDSGVYGPLPVEVAFFLDGGVTWNKGQKPSFFNGGTREPVTSGGITLRTNLLGFAVAQIDYARPFDRPGRGWIWGFSLTPGF